MKYILTFSVVAIIILFSTCKKGNTFTGPKIYTITDFRRGTYSTYNYNSDGTVLNVTNNVGSDTTYNYSGDTVMEVDYSGQYMISGFYYIKNSAGLADSAIGQYQVHNYSKSYTYDANNMLTQQKNYLSGVLQTTVNYTNSGKNIYEAVTINAGNNTSTYDYYTFFSSNSNTIGVQDEGKYHLGASITNPIQKDVNIANNLDTVYTLNYRYSYDGSGRIDTVVSHKTTWINNVVTLIDSVAISYY
jgi:hypothetical protein